MYKDLIDVYALARLQFGHLQDFLPTSIDFFINLHGPPKPGAYDKQDHYNFHS